MHWTKRQVLTCLTLVKSCNSLTPACANVMLCQLLWPGGLHASCPHPVQAAVQEQAPAAQPMEVDNAPSNAVAEATGQEDSAAEGASPTPGGCTTTSCR